MIAKMKKSCVVIGNGPSASMLSHPSGYQEFLLLLQEGQVDSICMNKFPRLILPTSKLWPTYYINGDKLVVVDTFSEIESYASLFTRLFVAFPSAISDGKIEKFPGLTSPYPNAGKLVYYRENYKKLRELPNVVPISHKISGLKAISIVVNLGYERIFIIGMDENYGEQLQHSKESYLQAGCKEDAIKISNGSYLSPSYIRVDDVFSPGNDNRISLIQHFIDAVVSNSSVELINLSSYSRISSIPKLKLTDFPRYLLGEQ
jgi:hypothetical protein